MDINTVSITVMNGSFGLDTTLKGYTGPGVTWVNEKNVVMKHAPSAG